MHPVIDDADAKEHRGRHEAVRDHLDQTAFDTHLAEQEKAERHEPHVRDRRVRDQLLHVLLHQRDEPDVDDRDQRQRDHETGERPRRIGNDRQDEAQEAIGADLQRDRREDDGASGGRLDVRIGQPRVHRPHRNLDGEREEERDEEQQLHLVRQRHLIPRLDLEVAAADVEQVQQRNQHQQRAEHRVQEELDRRIHAIGPAPGADDQVHRDQHRLEKEIEQHAVERGKHAVDEARLDQERGVILARALVDDDPSGDDDENRREAVEQHEQHRNAVDTEVIVDVVRRDPGRQFLELHAAERRIELRVERNRDEEAEHRTHQRDLPDQWQPVVARQRQNQHAGSDRHQDGKGQIGHVVVRRAITGFIFSRATRSAARRRRSASRTRSGRRIRSAGNG